MTVLRADTLWRAGMTRATPRRKRLTAQGVLCALVLFGAAVVSIHAQNGPDNDANGAPGFTKSVFDHGQIDSVNLYNGQLTIPLALGGSYPVGPKLRVQVAMTYNSRATDYGGPSPTWQSQEFTYQPLVGNPSLGIGWELTLGAIKSCKHGNITGYCYFNPDGSQHMFDLGSKTGDGTQLYLTGSGPFDMWDADGNHYVFGWQVSGYDDIGLPEGYTHDFGRGRDGWYLTSVTDPYGNGYSISYYNRATVPTPLWTYGVPSCNLQTVTNSMLMRNPSAVNTWIPKDITLPSGRQIHFNTGTVNGIAGMITSVDFPVFVGTPQTRTWTLVYENTFFVLNHACGYWNPPNPPPVLPVNLQRLKALQLPSDLPGLPSYQFSQTDLLNQITLPTGGSISYCYGWYTLYHARVGSLEPGCNGFKPSASGATVEQSSRCSGSSPVPSGPKPLIPGTCTPDNPATYMEHPTGVLQRREILGSTQSDTDYVQYGFPFGEGGSATSPQPAQSLTVVVSPPTDENGGTGRRRARAVLFDSAPSTYLGPNQMPPSVPGDRVGEDLDERTFETDPTLGAITDPPCSGNPATDSDFCGSKALRVTQKAYEYDTGGVIGGNRRVIREKTIHGASSCGSCPYHQVTFTLVPGNTWDGNGRHYDVETHDGNLGSSDYRKITTTWTPANWNTPPPSNAFSLPNLMSQRTECDGSCAPSSTVYRYFEYKTDATANGFLIGSAIWDHDRQRTFLSCFYNDGHGNVGQEFSATYAPQGSPPNNACQTTYPSFPTGAVGVNSDAFGKIHTYQNGLLITSRWMATPSTPANWYLRNYVRDPGTGWVTYSSDTAGLTTGYQYDSIGRVTLITPPGTEAATSVSYPLTTQTIAQRNAGVGLSTYEEYDYDGLGRLIRNRRLMPASQYSKRFTLYDGAGHAYFNSEWVADSTSESVTADLGTSCAFSTGSFPTSRPSSAPGTYRLCYDPFGRPQQVVGSKFSSLATMDRTDGSVWYSDTREATTVACVNGALQTSGACGSGGVNATATSRKDAWGRLTSVTEPSNDVTTYSYDVNGKLTAVSQGTQSRSFSFDPAGFLRSETTPEKGTVTYNDYGSLGNLRQRTENDGTVVSYLYDFAGRLACEGQGLVTTGSGLCPVNQSIQTLYVLNYYDGNGFGGGSYPLGKITQRNGYNPLVSGQPSFTDKFTYSNVAGRLSTLSTVAPGGLGQVDQSWSYNGLGLVAQHNHSRPASGSAAPFVVSTTYDAGFPTKLYVNGIPAVTGVTYASSQALQSYTTGLFSGKTVTTTITPDASLLPRPSGIATTGATVNFASGSYSYDGAGNIMAMGLDSFGYDSLSRLTSAALSGAGSQSFTYDRYGNLLTKSGTPGNTTFCSGSCTNNRLPGSVASYDGRGSITTNWIALGGAETYTFDGLDRQITHQADSLTWNYLYDGENERTVKILPGNAWSYTFRDEGKRVSSEFSASAPSRDNIFLGDLLAASYASIPGTDRVWTFYSSDHLGTPRLITDVTAAMVETPKNWPYGENVTTQGVFQRIRFASMERDTEASRYHDHARGHEFNLGRFLSVDVLHGNAANPQRWNSYTYALDNPTRFVDPFGLSPENPGTLGDRRLQNPCFFFQSLCRGGAVQEHLTVLAANAPSLHTGLAGGTNSSVGSKDFARGVFKRTADLTEGPVNILAAGAVGLSYGGFFVAGASAYGSASSLLYFPKAGTIVLGRFGALLPVLQKLASEVNGRVLTAPIPRDLLRIALEWEIESAQKIWLNLANVTRDSITGSIELPYILSRPDLKAKTDFVTRWLP